MKQSVVLLTCLVLISSSGFQSSVAVSYEASCKDNPTRDHDLMRQDDAQPATLATPHAQRPDLVSPYEIKQYIDEHQKDESVSLAEYWDRLKIEIEEWGAYGRCEATLFKLGPGLASTILLRLYDPSGWSMGGTRYLFFKPIASAHDRWRLLGYVDFADQRYGVPEHRIITSGPDHWFVLTMLAGRGSGYHLNHDQWYEIDDSGVRLVLSYPSSKFLSWRDPIPVLKASSRFISATTESDRTSVVIEFSASYALYGGAHLKEKIELWTKTQRAVFVRSSGEERFRLESRRSQLSNKELDAIFDGEGPSDSEILRYNVDDLERIATGTNDRAKEWLRSYLSECRNTTDRERLLKALAP